MPARRKMLNAPGQEMTKHSWFQKNYIAWQRPIEKRQSGRRHSVDSDWKGLSWDAQRFLLTSKDPFLEGTVV